jgi:hypothetical protein
MGRAPRTHAVAVIAPPHASMVVHSANKPVLAPCIRSFEALASTGKAYVT